MLPHDQRTAKEANSSQIYCKHQKLDPRYI